MSPLSPTSTQSLSVLNKYNQYTWLQVDCASPWGHKMTEILVWPRSWLDTVRHFCWNVSPYILSALPLKILRSVRSTVVIENVLIIRPWDRVDRHAPQDLFPEMWRRRCGVTARKRELDNAAWNQRTQESPIFENPVHNLALHGRSSFRDVEVMKWTEKKWSENTQRHSEPLVLTFLLYHATCEELPLMYITNIVQINHQTM